MFDPTKLQTLAPGGGMIYIPAKILLDARTVSNHTLIIHSTEDNSYRATSRFRDAAEIPSTEVVCYGSDGKGEVFRDGYGEMTREIARGIADNSDDAGEYEIESAFQFFMDRASGYEQDFFKDEDLQGKRDYLWNLANGPVSA